MEDCIIYANKAFAFGGVVSCDGKRHFFPLDRKEKQRVQVSSVFESGKLKKGNQTGDDTENNREDIESAGAV